jgi:hypothetical protein
VDPTWVSDPCLHGLHTQGRGGGGQGSNPALLVALVTPVVPATQEAERRDKKLQIPTFCFLGAVCPGASCWTSLSLSLLCKMRIRDSPATGSCEQEKKSLPVGQPPSPLGDPKTQFLASKGEERGGRGSRWWSAVRTRSFSVPLQRGPKEVPGP